jgi:hypothetical protein
LGTTALCSFAGLAALWQSEVVFGLELFFYIAAVIASSLFIGFVWRDGRYIPRRNQIRAHQERHAMMLSRESQAVEEITIVAPTPVAAEADEPAKVDEVPETLLVTSLTDVVAERSVQRRQQARRAAEALATAA